MYTYHYDKGVNAIHENDMGAGGTTAGVHGISGSSLKVSTPWTPKSMPFTAPDIVYSLVWCPVRFLIERG